MMSMRYGRFDGEDADVLTNCQPTSQNIAATQSAQQGSTMKPDWHDLPTEPGLWLVHAKGSRTDVGVSHNRHRRNDGLH